MGCAGPAAGEGGQVAMERRQPQEAERCGEKSGGGALDSGEVSRQGAEVIRRGFRAFMR